MLKKCENWICHEFSTCDGPRLVWGTEALAAKFEIVSLQHAAGAVKSLSDVENFKRFGWLLEPKHEADVKGWIADFLKSKRSALFTPLLCLGDGKAVPSSGVGHNKAKPTVAGILTSSTLGFGGFEYFIKLYKSIFCKNLYIHL